MEFKGTKGEWEVSIICRPMGKHTMNREILYNLQEKTFKLHPQKEHEANAQLIATAPELLEALIETEKDLCVLWGQMLDIEKTNIRAEGLSNLIDKWRLRNKQAINKALNNG
jgi:hypothetical protein